MLFNDETYSADEESDASARDVEVLTPPNNDVGQVDDWTMLPNPDIMNLPTEHGGNANSPCEYNAATIKTWATIIYGQIEYPENQAMALGVYSSKFKRVAAHKDVCKLASAIDMFLFRFPLNEHAKLRVGTCVYRDKDSAALSTMIYLKRYLSMNYLSDIMFWMFNDTVKTEVKRILTNGEEIDDINSYVHYMMGYGVSLRSPYSSAVNQGVYFICSSAAALCGSKRGCYARCMIDTSAVTLENISLLFYLAHRNKSVIKYTLFKNLQDVRRGTRSSRPTSWNAKYRPSRRLVRLVYIEQLQIF